jgi:hypothetical protein
MLSKHVSRRLSDDGVQRRILNAATALMMAETTRRAISPEIDKPHQKSETDVASNLGRLHSNQIGVSQLPSLFPHVLPVANRAECEGFSAATRFTRLRRHQTITKMKSTASKATLDSKYKVQWQKPLGEGSFGSVYHATDRATGESVAVKKIPKELTDNESFQREMDALLHLRDNGGHPHICGLKENFEEGEHFCK